MSLKFNLLSDLLLQEVFKFSGPAELLEYRFLNKYLFGVVISAIKYNLIRFIYNQKRFQQYRYYQEEFIKQNEVLMIHLNLYNGDTKCLSYCSDLTSVQYSSDSSLDNIDKIKIEIGLPYLKN
ncbi:hypothetical protein K502DRAFT_346137 [Neoconidiobolus thromboides FSU 785]|nr:hypothetical protein K502DRAFT_346137 [Neoconidiobolus thromboides FSU 785]